MPVQLWNGRWRGRSPSGDQHQRSREVISPSGGIMRGKFPSLKNGRVIHHEGLLELDAIFLFELSPQITSYREQPTRLTYSDGSRIRRYTPDFELTLVSGELVWVEVKPLRFCVVPDTQQKLSCIAAQMRDNGKAFEILTDEVLRLEPRQSVVRTLWHRVPKAMRPVEAGRFALAGCMTSFPMSLERAATLLEGKGLNVYSLILQGLLTCDLSSPLSANSLITIGKEGDHEWFRISQARDF
ncbi:TnsA endonuclease N-terminal domain-containing protein [Aquabacterium sp.]|uniref:TnsA endonuclease N-terminal domain-containing protein n=1 Tax=Aquabacterium sp. TaxID=1872578 RepID=UPI002489271B|nr:TnsA endonuclease N-terminal domain-containing protein [Aquabacterium sp.]MDI1260191.1 TnsA endonuclease N-terminal domain-containing protein [Aquabacterium sp.]